MTLLVAASALLARRSAAADALGPLAQSLRRELAPFLVAPPDLPRGKALLTRAGGRCANDGELLAYDPWSPRHACPRCGREVRGEVHDRFRIHWHQLWLAERTLHSALLGVLLEETACIEAATMMLGRYARRYLDYPNSDNVLGPSRPFFSTYLESIWLLQLMLALDLLEAGAPSAEMRVLGADVRANLVAPSAALIASYDEGMSNRQVWNNAALLGASVLLDDPELREHVLHGPSGLHAHLGQALLADGSWYEGENYHLFAHRGLWYGVRMAERLGLELPADLARRFDAGFVAPFRTMLPDLTLPSRRDSQYSISVRQPRFAESCELGFARTGDERLAGILAQLYDPSVPSGDTGRSRSTADVERNLKGTGLTRADLSWRALLLATPELPAGTPAPLVSDLLPSQGIAVLRQRGGELYAALDYGHSGGGHGHPDRLQLLLSMGATRILDDPGTGSYVDPMLHWYRSTMAHCAPIIDGESQPRVDGTLLAFDAREHAAWASAEARLADDLVVRRTVVLLDDHLVDELAWESTTEPHDVALPLHGIVLASAPAADEAQASSRAVVSPGDGEGDGNAWLADLHEEVAGASPVEVRRASTSGQPEVRGWISAPVTTEWWGALAPGPPADDTPRPVLLVRANGARGAITTVWSWGDVPSAPEFGDGRIQMNTAGGVTVQHERIGDSWRVRMAPGETIELSGLVQRSADGEVRGRTGGAGIAMPEPPFALSRAPLVFELGEPHYRRSEERWDQAGRPRARIDVSWESDTLLVRIDIVTPHINFVSIDTENPLDNEPMAINGDGVQLYLNAEDVSGAWLAVPDPHSSEVGVRPVDGWPGAAPPVLSWNRTPGGYDLTARVSLPDDVTALSLDVLVNLSGPGRLRRRGQLVLSGAVGDFVYLRGDRQNPSRLLRFVRVDD